MSSSDYRGKTLPNSALSHTLSIAQSQLQSPRHSLHAVLHIASPDKSKVALISGGGSGHEPSHAGMVGTNSLTAAVGGNIFASPNANQVRHALSLVENEKG